MRGVLPASSGPFQSNLVWRPCVAGIYLDQHMHMVGHDFHLQNLGMGLDSDLSQDDPQFPIDPFHKNPAAVSRAPHHMALAGIETFRLLL